MKNIIRSAIFVFAAAIFPAGQAQDMTTGASVQAPGNVSIDFQSEGMRLRLEEIAQTKNVIWAMDFIDSNTMIFTERPGRIGLLRLDNAEITFVEGAPEVYAMDSGGLFDILVDPDFEHNRWIYLTYIKKVGDDSVTAVARGKLRGNKLIEVRDLFVANNASADHAHWGSRIVMGRDRMLYFSVGDRHVPDSAQNLTSHGGKILRLKDDGGIPPDNPFAGREDAAPEIWSYGHRNPQGLTIHPDSHRLFEQEHGPTGGDEINIIKRGKNYGWPVITYGTDIWGGQQAAGTSEPGMEQPVKYYQPGIAPSGMTFYFGSRYPAWHGSLFNSTLRGHLNRLVLDHNDRIEEERLLNEWRERVRDVAQGPDELLYLATESGRIARIVPVQSDHTYKTDAGPFEVAVAGDVLLAFDELDKDLPLRVAYPLKPGPNPVIVFSHGGGCAKDTYSRLADHWASHGYVVIAPLHSDSRSLGFSFAGTDSDVILQVVYSRRLDMRHILDSLDTIEALVPELAGRLDRQRLVAAGHSMGGATAMAVTGLELKNNVTGVVNSFPEDRFDALLLIGDPGARGFMPDAPWRAVSVPTLIITGTNDRGARVDASRMQFDIANPAKIADTPNHYLFITGMDHYMGGLICRSDIDGEPDYDALAIARGVSTAFLDAYMKDNDAAGRFLRGEALPGLTDNRATLENR